MDIAWLPFNLGFSIEISDIQFRFCLVLIGQSWSKSAKHKVKRETTNEVKESHAHRHCLGNNHVTSIFKENADFVVTPCPTVKKLLAVLSWNDQICADV